MEHVAARSNHFRVKDEGAFLAWVETLPGVGAHRDTPMGEPDGPEGHPHPSYALLADGADGAWPTFREITRYPFDGEAYIAFGRERLERLRAGGASEERLKLVGAAMSAEYFRRLHGATEEVEFDWASELSPHLLEGEVAVFEETGADKLRYLFANAFAVNHRGELLELDLSEIYDRVEQAGWAQNVSKAVY